MSQLQPNLFIVGAPKCGTTAWVTYLSRHEDVFFCDPKEPHHFNTDIPEFRWARSREEYLGLFADAGKAKAIGEASILYLYSRDAAENIHAFAPEARILIFVRSPAKFIPSYHQQQLYNLDEDVTALARAWHLSGRRTSADLPTGCRDPKLLDYKSVGLFGAQAERYLTRFGEDRVRIVRFEDWVKDPRKTYLLLLDFLGLHDDGQVDFEQVNAAHDHRSQLLAGLTQRPPTVARLASRTLRKLPGLSGFRPARLLRRLNRREGYRQHDQDQGILAEIVDHYAEDQKKLDDLINKVGLHAQRPREKSR